MIRNNFLYNVRSRVRWNDDTIEDIDLLVEADNETAAKEIATERLMDDKHWKTKEIMWQELTASKYYLTRE